MTEPHEENLFVHITVDDAKLAEAAGIKFAHTLAGANPHDFALALAEQEHMIQRAIIEAGYSAEQAALAAGHFEVAAQDEWRRIVVAGSGELGRA